MSHGDSKCKEAHGATGAKVSQATRTEQQQCKSLEAAGSSTPWSTGVRLNEEFWEVS